MSVELLLQLMIPMMMMSRNDISLVSISLIITQLSLQLLRVYPLLWYVYTVHEVFP